MVSYPPALEQLIELFSKLPGVGRKTAERYVLYLLKQPTGLNAKLAQALQVASRDIKLCSNCFQFTTDPLCPICANAQRDHHTICVVQESSAVLAFEQTGDYNGVYHVLGGTANQLEGFDAERLRIPVLLKRITNNGVTEIIIGTNADHAGEATALLIKTALKGAPVKMTRLARGLPAGSEIEFADDVTLGQALVHRQAV